jgi:hypothetical protein
MEPRSDGKGAGLSEGKRRATDLTAEGGSSLLEMRTTAAAVVSSRARITAKERRQCPASPFTVSLS